MQIGAGAVGIDFGFGHRIDDTVDILRYSNFTTGRLPNDVEDVNYKARFSDPDISRTEVEELYSIMLGIS